MKQLVQKLSLLSFITFAAWSHAADHRPIKLVVGFSAGGATDVAARALAQRLETNLQRTVLVENKPGAGGNLAAVYVAKAVADGNTLLVSSPAEIVMNPYVYKDNPINPATDLQPVSKISTAPLVLVTHIESPLNSVKTIIKSAKGSEKGLNYASSGTGGPQHFAGELFQMRTHTHMAHIPYKGGAPATADLLGKQVDLFFAGVPPVLPHIKAGKLRALAVTSPQRFALLPDTPTLQEQGIADFAIENWQGVFVPKNTPPETVAALNHEIQTLRHDSAFQQVLEKTGSTISLVSGQAFEQFLSAERQKYQAIATAAKLQ